MRSSKTPPTLPTMQMATPSIGSNDPIGPFRPVADAIALLFAPYTEVVIHDLSTQKVIHISNNLSKRDIGDDSALEKMVFTDREQDVIGPYKNMSWNGKNIHSISAVLRNGAGAPMALMCINFYVAELEEAGRIINLLTSKSTLIPRPEKLFEDDWQLKVNTFINHWLDEHGLVLSGLGRAEKRKLIEALYLEGAFEARSAADYISRVLSIGRATVFNYLKSLRQNP